MPPAKPIPSVYQKLAVRPVIHGAGTNTRYGGSLMRPETIAAMREASQAFVNIDELNDCLLYTSPSPRDRQKSRMPSSA